MRHFTVVALLLVGCSGQQDEKICVPPSSYQANEDFLACVHREAYQLAGAPGSSEAVAQAVVAGCIPDIQRYVEESEEADKDALYANIHSTAEQFALYFVTQARAGNCDVPDRAADRA